MSSDSQMTLCGCRRCVEARQRELPKETPIHQITLGPSFPGWRFACEICGKKRCPHHTNHLFTCTGSNATGQVGSDYA